MVATTEKRPKKGLFSKLRKKKEKTETPVKQSKKEESRTPPPSPEPESPAAEETPTPVQSKAKMSMTRDGVPVVTGDNPDDFVPSDVRKTTPEGPTVTKSKKSKKKKGRSMVTLDKAPTAKQSAFSGPPRYDWIDIETAAAVKVQAAYRRNKVMAQLEEEGKTTAAIRNRARRRKARQDLQVSEDTPSIFRCCGLGLAFGDGTEEDFATTRAHEKEAYETKKRLKEEREAELRSKHRIHKKPSVEMMEGLEVVEEADQ